MRELFNLISRYGASSWDKQSCLADLIGTMDWQLDLETGLITFGERYTFPAQVLGSEGYAGGTWLWIWANDAYGPDEHFTRAANQMRAYGESNDIAEFKLPEFPLAMANGHTLSMICSGLCKADCYYRGPYEGGAVFLLIEAPEVRELANDTVPSFIRVFTEFMMAVECDHRLALESYAAYKGYTFEGVGNDAVCTAPTGTQIRATFDDLGRVTGLKTLVTPEEVRESSEKTV